jgi:large subunit ribosomal protein L29
MKANELREKDLKELASTLIELRKEQFNLRMQQGSGQLSRPSQMKAVRRDIARIKTLMHQQSAGEES